MIKRSKDELEKFSKIVLKLRNKKEVVEFFEDVLSPKEMETILLKIKIADLLLKKFTYIEIERLTGASSATIAKVSEALNYGNGMFRRVIERI